jgi:hypothetical protein
MKGAMCWRAGVCWDGSHGARTGGGLLVEGGVVLPGYGAQVLAVLGSSDVNSVRATHTTHDTRRCEGSNARCAGSLWCRRRGVPVGVGQFKAPLGLGGLRCSGHHLFAVHVEPDGDGDDDDVAPAYSVSPNVSGFQRQVFKERRRGTHHLLFRSDLR